MPSLGLTLRKAKHGGTESIRGTVMDRLAKLYSDNVSPRTYTVQVRTANQWVSKGTHDSHWMADKQRTKLLSMGFPRARIIEVIRNEDN